MSVRISHKVFCLSVFFCLLFAGQMQAQYTYFNQISGEVDDQSSEQTANIEVVDDGYVIWGVGIDDGQLFHFMYKYDFEGDIVDENELIFEDEYLYAGIVNSMQWNPYTEQFVVLQGSTIDGELSARLLSFTNNLELDQDLVYDTYAPNTYFYSFLIEDDSYIVLGEQGEAPNSEGTFIMKMDFDGEVIWNKILQEEVYQNVYRNVSIENTLNNYLIFGGGLVDERFGLITVTDLEGNTLSEVEVIDEDAVLMGRVRGIIVENGECLFTIPIGYEIVEEINDPDIAWSKTVIGKYDPETEDVTIIQEYFTDYECFRCGPNDIEPTSDGGAIILGGRPGWSFDAYAWIMKVDADGNQEWFREYTYESCDDCTNQLYDIEIAPDGGYVAAGYFQDFSLDGRRNPWLLKVDACGDVEWEDCPPPTNGLRKKEAKSFSIYPNPSTGRFTVRTAAIEQRPSSGVEMSRHETQKRIVGYEVVDRMGRVLDSARTPTHQLTTDGLEINIDAPTGLYLLRLQLDDGSAESYRVEIAK